jgi:hypothetical protein
MEYTNEFVQSEVSVLFERYDKEGFYFLGITRREFVLDYFSKNYETVMVMQLQREIEKAEAQQ